MKSFNSSNNNEDPYKEIRERLLQKTHEKFANVPPFIKYKLLGSVTKQISTAGSLILKIQNANYTEEFSFSKSRLAKADELLEVQALKKMYLGNFVLDYFSMTSQVSYKECIRAAYFLLGELRVPEIKEHKFAEFKKSEEYKAFNKSKKKRFDRNRKKEINAAKLVIEKFLEPLNQIFGNEKAALLRKLHTATRDISYEEVCAVMLVDEAFQNNHFVEALKIMQGQTQEHDYLLLLQNLPLVSSLNLTEYAKGLVALRKLGIASNKNADAIARNGDALYELCAVCDDVKTENNEDCYIHDLIFNKFIENQISERLDKRTLQAILRGENVMFGGLRIKSVISYVRAKPLADSDDEFEFNSRTNLDEDSVDECSSKRGASSDESDSDSDDDDQDEAKMAPSQVIRLRS